jgi:hypothetical protein
MINNKLISAIKSISDVEQFFKHLTLTENLAFHPDDDFKDYVTNSNEPFYTTQKAELLNNLMNDCFEVCESEKVDVYGVALGVVEEYSLN